MIGEENLTCYRFGLNENRFCKTCGVHVDLHIRGPPEEELKTWAESRRGFLEMALTHHPVNIRILDDVEWKGQPGEVGGENVPGKVQISRVDGKSMPSPFDNMNFIATSVQMYL